MSRQAIFFDRDGTLNEEACYLSDPLQLKMIDGAGKAVRALNEADYKVIVFTNQAGVARGYFSEEQLHAVNAAMLVALSQEGARVDGIYYCPHHPEHGIGRYRKDCECRKPKPGMLLTAATDLDIDLARSFVIGDKVLDLEAGHAAGCTNVLVRTGYGRESEQTFQSYSFQPDYVADDAWQAAQWILKQA